MPIPTQQTTENILLPFSRDVAGPYYRVKESTQHQAKLELRSLKWMIERYTEVGGYHPRPNERHRVRHNSPFHGQECDKHRVGEKVPRHTDPKLRAYAKVV